MDAKEIINKNHSEIPKYPRGMLPHKSASMIKISEGPRKEQSANANEAKNEKRKHRQQMIEIWTGNLPNKKKR